MEPGQRPSAPGALQLVQQFINTNDIEGNTDALGGREELRAWLTTHELLADGESVSEDELHGTLAFREALRALALANNGEALPADALATLNRIAAAGTLILHFTADGHTELRPATGGVQGALARMLGIVYTAMREGTWSRLRACREDLCRWAFYDSSKNRSGQWCVMSICGNRNKVRAYQQRRRARIAS